MKKKTFIATSLSLISLMCLFACTQNKSDDKSSSLNSSSTKDDSLSSVNGSSNITSSNSKSESSISNSSASSTSSSSNEEANKINLHKYFLSEKLPEIRIDTLNNIAIDDASLIDPTKHKGCELLGY